VSSIDTSNVERIITQIDRMIDEMTTFRSQLASLKASARPNHSFRDADYFGMWADREDMRGLTSREWLEKLRSQQRKLR
jgi:hypothetical protein